ncbi:MAG TPA: isoaspartyl peptidase/L-asparaginase, partial [Pyrinomonadaceae bacterium]|nr:isoaspartyl peptidase/L-asparaginase [Pyrinomonadaceae bacterium]
MRPSLAIHGGAGTILKSEMTPDLEKEYRHGLQSALDAGWAVLSKGGPALEAVQSAVVSLEDFPLFNAGRGSVFTHTARNEMDACIMDGARLMSGAVAFVSNIRNPITLARLVMEETEHCLLAGNGAVEFAREHGVAFEPDEYFFTEHRYRQLLTAIEDGRVALDHSDRPADPNYSKNSITPAANSMDYRDYRPPAADFKDSRPPAADSIDSRDSSPGLELESVESLESREARMEFGEAEVESLESAEGCLESTQSQIENRKSKMG